MRGVFTKQKMWVNPLFLFLCTIFFFWRMERQFAIPQAPTTFSENHVLLQDKKSETSSPEEGHKRSAESHYSTLPKPQTVITTKSPREEHPQKSANTIGHFEKSSVKHLITVSEGGGFPFSPSLFLSFNYCYFLVKTQIPQSLVILPSDTESQKAAKKKKLHSLQCLAKRKEEEERGNQVQQNWLAFKSKLDSKNKKKLGSKAKH